MIRYNQTNVDRVSENILLVKEYSNKLSQLSASEKEKFWGALKGVLEQIKKGHSERRDMVLSQKAGIEHPGAVLAQCKYHAGYIGAIEEIIDIVDNNDDALAEATARMKELEKQKADIENNIELQ